MPKKITREEVKEKLGVVCFFCGHWTECEKADDPDIRVDGCRDFEFDYTRDPNFCCNTRCDLCYFYILGICEGKGD